MSKAEDLRPPRKFHQGNGQSYAPFSRRTCGRKGCAKVGKYLPILCYPPPPPYRQDQDNHIQATLDLPVCKDHMKAATVAELLHDEGWQKMVHYFAALGVVTPRRADTYLKFKRV